MTLADLEKMDDREIATYASGGYGAPKRGEMMAAIRHAIARARAAGPVEVLPFGATSRGQAPGSSPA